MLDQWMFFVHHFKAVITSYTRIRPPFFIGHLTVVKLFSPVQALFGVLGSVIRNYHLRQSFWNTYRELEHTRPNVTISLLTLNYL
jgi:hypothetical protein